MAWGPQGDTKYERNPMTKESIQAMALDEKIIAEFVALIREGDELYYEAENNNHRGYARIVGKRQSGLTYCYVIHSFMS